MKEFIISNPNYDLSKLRGEYRWVGWSIHKFVPAPNAMFSPHGSYHNGRYGYTTTYEVGTDGKWHI